MTLHPARPGTLRFLAWLVAGVLGLNLVIVGYTGINLERSRRDVDSAALQWTQNLSLALEKELAGVIRAADLVLLSAIDEYQRQRARGPVDTAAMTAQIKRLRERFPFSDGIRFADAEGILRFGSEVDPGKRVDISDREHFRTLIDHAGDRPVVSRPQISRANGKRVIVIARRLSDPDGGFDGIAFVPLPVEHLTRTFSQISLPEQSSITLRGFDLGIIARYPMPAGGPEPVGQATVAPAFIQMLANGATTGSFAARTPLDGIDRVLSFRKVGDYPLYLIVGRAEAEYLGEWRRERALAAVTLALFLALTAALSGFACWSWRRLARARDEMERMAHTDFLTGLANRRAFIATAEREILRARRYGKPLSVLIFDIDHFKRVNDARGHEFGDRVLQEVAATARAALRGVDLIGRWGGEEFVALLPETAADAALEAAERLRSAVAAAAVGGERLTVSVGAAAHRGDEEIDDLVRRADEALYRAKNGGRNRVCAAGPAAPAP